MNIPKITQGIWKANPSTHTNDVGQAKSYDILIEDWDKRPSPIVSWIVSFIPSNDFGISKSTNESLEQCDINAHAICDAVNNTYGKGIDPIGIGERMACLKKENEELKKKLETIKSILNP